MQRRESSAHRRFVQGFCLSRHDATLQDTRLRSVTTLVTRRSSNKECSVPVTEQSACGEGVVWMVPVPNTQGRCEGGYHVDPAPHEGLAKVELVSRRRSSIPYHPNALLHQEGRSVASLRAA
jgi:hypothetical protein